MLHRLFLAGLALLAAPAAAQVQAAGPPPGAYRTAAAYRHRQPQPAGTTVYYPDKRGQVVVLVPRGPATEKRRIAPDSLWGFVAGNGRTVRLYRGGEYRLEAADTLCLYSGSAAGGGGPVAGLYGGRGAGATRYYFSRGPGGFIFPLTLHYLREMYTASYPAFVVRLGQLGFAESLMDVDRHTGRYRVSTLYHDPAAPGR